MKATLITGKSQISPSGAEQHLYRLDPPFEYTDWDDEKSTHEYVVVSAVHVLGQPETYIFPADEKGEITNWTELPGSSRGVLDHDGVLERMGYEVSP